MLRSLFLKIEHVYISATGELSWMAKVFAAIAAFFAPIHTLVALMMLFLAFDTASAIYLRYKIEREKRRKCSTIQVPKMIWGLIDPEKLQKTIEKLFAYPVIIIACFIVDRMVLGTDVAGSATIGKFSLTNFAFIVIVLIDFKSFLRNMGKATGNEVYRVVEKMLARKIKDKFPDETTN